jgi:alcohol dehydrogenase
LGPTLGLSCANPAAGQVKRGTVCVTPTIPAILDFQPRTRIIFGVGAVDRLGELVREYGGTRVLVVSDPGIVAAGHVDRAEASLAAAGLCVNRFDGVRENPTTEVVDACVAVARQHNIDILIGLGGGSSMDAAKGCNFLLTNGGRMEDYWGVGKATKPMLPLIAVPTTAGTGSECQSFALITHPETHAKMACGDPKAAAKVAILDPELTLTQPPAVAAATGMDALSHALETAVTRRRNLISQMFSREAFRLCSRGLRRVFDDPNDVDARADVLLGAALAGMAIENSMLGAAHAAANPLTARYGVLHGHAVGMMLPAVIKFNAQDDGVAPLYHELAVQGGLLAAGKANGAPAADKISCFLRGFQRQTGLPESLNGLEIKDRDIEALAADAAKQWTGTFNPIPVGPQEFERLYREVLIEGGSS